MTREDIDRRRFPRGVNFPCLIIIRYSKKAPEFILTHIENISMGGIAVILVRNLAPFRTVELEIDLLDMQDHVKCYGKIARVKEYTNEEGTKCYDSGIEFMDVRIEDIQRINNAVQWLLEKSSERQKMTF